MNESPSHRGGSMNSSTEKLFFRCTRWQVEETTDLVSCPFHYFCDSGYQEDDYPLAVDLLVVFFTISSLVSIAAFTLLEFAPRPSSIDDCTIGRLKRRYLLPSGPIALPLVVLILANGSRIGTLLPFSRIGPALLQLVYISAMAFRNRAESDIKYSVLEASTVSGILHASLHLDSVLLPYYTGLAALRESAFSGLCETCVCRKSALVRGGSAGGYRGWSAVTVLTASAICARMACRVFGDERLSLAIRVALEGVSWVLIAADCLQLWIRVAEWRLLDLAIYGGLCALIFLNFVRMVINLSASLPAKHRIAKALPCYEVEIV